ncbi:hypothetical protein [Methanobacterium sp. ACI-7]|uniref:hypothetical protein n=1 Tax=unclassified Methanobacterium TaxID=2627676 RepID=UPI0039C35CAA
MKPPKINKENCGCSIEDLLNENTDKEKRLCSASPNDMEVYIEPDAEKISYELYMKKQTDGLPIIPPTGERVRKFIDFSSFEKDDLIAVLPPRSGKATVEKIAINSVMAGCIPQFMPIIQHSIKAIESPEFNLPGVNATTHPVAICAILNGPIANEIGINSGAGCLSPGNIANATIGRAIRLCLLNIAGAVPGIGDHATMGSPSKYSFCFGEAENENPWKPLHVERGFKETESTVTMMALDSPHNVNDHRSKTAEDIMDTIIDTAAVAGCNNSHVPGEMLIIMSPEHAKTIADDGWNKEDIKSYFHENALVPAEFGDRGGRKLDEKWIIDGDVQITRSPKDVVVVVAGGPGRHTMISHGFGTSSESVTELIKLKDGTAASSILDFKK